LNTFIKISHIKFFRTQKNLIQNKESFMIYDSQVYTALCISLLAGILAIRLGSTLNE